MQNREDLECCKQSLMSDAGGSSEDQIDSRNAVGKHCASEVSHGNEISWELD
jgi:hypothetical protein